METTKAEGVLREAAGQVEGAAGELMGDPAVQLSGKAKELAGKAQQVYADLEDMVRDSTVERPFMALGIAVAVGFVLGMLRTTLRNTPDDARRR
jgi:uncharacterized protein YjbJ (UPF0337 family)